MISARVVLTMWAGLLALLCPSNGLAFQTIEAGEATAVQVTVYTENVALVQESRKV